MGFLVEVLAFIGQVAANLGSAACAYIILDEPECPKSLIK